MKISEIMSSYLAVLQEDQFQTEVAWKKQFLEAEIHFVKKRLKQSQSLEFDDFLESASKTVATYPEWKRNIL